MKQTLAVILTILLMIAALALGLVIGGAIVGDPGLPDDGSLDLPIDPSTDDLPFSPPEDSDSDALTGDPPPTDTETPSTLPPITDPDAYVIPGALFDYAKKEGTNVSLTWGAFGVTFPMTYRLAYVSGAPTLIAPDGASLRFGYTAGVKDITTLGPTYVNSVIAAVIKPVPDAELKSATDVTLADAAFGKTARFSFAVTVGKAEITYEYLLFADATRTYTLIVTHTRTSSYVFADVLATLEPRKEIETEDPGVVLPPDDFFGEDTKPPVTQPPVTNPPDTKPPVVDPPVTNPPEGYVIPPAFKDSAVMVGNDRVKLTFGKYAVTFSTTYQLVDLGNGMPTLIAPDGSRAVLEATPDRGSYQDVVKDVTGMSAYQKQFVQSFGGSNFVSLMPPMHMPMNGKDLVLSTCTFQKGGTDYEMKTVVFIEDGTRHTVCIANVKGSQYSFMELLETIEKA